MIKINPSVILNITEHHTHAQANKLEGPVIGALLGRKDTILESLEIIKDQDRNLKRFDLVKQTFTELNVVGLYSTTRYDPNELKELELPGHIFLFLDPQQQDGYLALNCYNQKPDGSFNDLTWTLLSDETEIIALEHAKGADGRLQPQLVALKRLRQRLRLMSKFVKDVQAGVIAENEEVNGILRDIGALTHKCGTKHQSENFNIRCIDVALQTYLGIMIKGSHIINKSCKPKIKKHE